MNKIILPDVGKSAQHVHLMYFTVKKQHRQNAVFFYFVVVFYKTSLLLQSSQKEFSSPQLDIYGSALAPVGTSAPGKPTNVVFASLFQPVSFLPATDYFYNSSK
jgi:hypothetical protein